MNDLIVDSSQHSVSRTHAEIELLADGRVVVRDLDALNGTYVDGRRVRGESVLPRGGRLTLGDEARYRIDWLTEEESSQLERGLVDELTGCRRVEAYRAELADAHARAVDSGGSVALVLLDLDLFGRFNKLHGLATGDAVLRTVGACLRESLAEHQRLAFRRGGEEFALVLPGGTLESAVSLAERVRRSLESCSVATVSGRLTVTASFGCAALGTATVSDADLEDLADRRLRMAKERGRNRVEPVLPTWGDETTPGSGQP